MCLNYDKFSIYFSSNVGEEMQQEISRSLGFGFLLILRDIWAYQIWLAEIEREHFRG